MSLIADRKKGREVVKKKKKDGLFLAGDASIS